MSNTDLDALKKHESVLRLYLSRLKFRRDGREYVAGCPNHADKTPSLKLYQDSDGTWIFKCFGQCKRAGNVFQFIEMVDKVTFKAAVDAVEAHTGKSWEKVKSDVESTFKPAITEPKKDLVSFSLADYSRMEQKLEENLDAQRWLLSARGITYETAKALHLGYRQDIGKLAGEKIRDIADKGWVTLPCIEHGRVVSIEYRSIVRKEFRRQPGMATALFNTTDIDPLETVYLTEGKFDAAVMKQAGYNVVSLPSASFKLTADMKDMLMQSGEVILAGDCDGGAGDDAMQDLWKELKHRTYLLKWPEGMKDANQTYLEQAHGSVSAFRTIVDDLTIKAKSRPMPSIQSLQEVMLTGGNTTLADHPQRMHFPWPAVDKMAVCLPGSVISSYATNTGQGKTTFWMNASVYGARKWDEVVLNYQCELSADEFATIVASYVLRKHRNTLTKDDMREAAEALKGVKYYIGNNPSLNTVTPVLDVIEAAVRRLGVTLAILDHLHFICLNEKDEIQAQANAMQRIKNMAREFGVKFIVIGQPRKADSKSKGKATHITDWKGSEAGTSSADAVYAIHRDYVKNIDPMNPPQDIYSPETDITNQKARSKGSGAAFARLSYLGEFATFVELSKSEPPPGFLASQ